jgi:hypothetical protein
VESVSGDAITVTSSFTWAQNDSVYYGTDTTPDIGPYPYKAGGYSLSATYTNVGGTVTVTPNDTSLVRFVVVYEDGIPKCVDNASPYTCAVGAGTIVAKAYPLYASTTLWAVAAEDDEDPVVTITAPASGEAFSTAVSPLTTLAGTCVDSDIDTVTWSNDRGGSGTATGTDTWSVASITLQNGANVITVTCTDLAAHTDTDIITVTYATVAPSRMRRFRR